MSEEAKQVYEQLSKKFLDFVILDDYSTEDQVVAKMDELSKRWRLYCNRKALLPAAYPILDEYMAGLIKQYQEMDKKTEEGFGVTEPKVVDNGVPS